MGKPSLLFNKLSDLQLTLVLFAYTLLLRFPFFFRDYVDRDESTFILMGQSWADGFLPYVQLWDIKPPLTFFFFGAIISIFGKSFIAIRLAGVVLVTVTAFFTYRITKLFTPKTMALVTALLCVALQSLFGSLQGVMSEHIAMAFVTPAIWLLVQTEKNSWQTMGVGLLMGVALMVKLNLAYVALFMGLALCYFSLRKRMSVFGLWHPFLYGTGILLVFFLTFLPYYVQGQGMLWWRSVVEAPLAYAGAREYSNLKLFGYILPFLMVLLLGLKSKTLKLGKPVFLYLAIILIGTLIAFVKSGRVNGHYLILAYPIILPLLAAIIAKKTTITRKVFQILCLFYFLVPMESYLEYYRIAKHKIERGSYFNGEGITAATYFKENDLKPKSIYFSTYHIGYWVMGMQPPTKAATQPSNILKEEMFFAYENPRKTGVEELRFIMENQKPEYIITQKYRRVFDQREYGPNFYMQLQLWENYHPLDTIDNAVIHKRLKFD